MTATTSQITYSKTTSQIYSTTANSEKQTNDFQKILTETSNSKNEKYKSKNDDLFDFEYFNTLNEKEKIEHRKKISTEFSMEKSMAFTIAASFGDINMQKAVYEKTSTMPEGEVMAFSLDMQISARRYLSGMELKASYSVVVENGYINNGSEKVNTNEYFKNMSSSEFNFFFSTMSTSHSSFASVVGRNQAMPYASAYKDILQSYKTSLKDNFQIEEKSNNTNSNKTQEENMEVLRSLAEDIFSLLKTGFTVSELELLQELLRKLREDIKKGNYTKQEADQLIRDVEKSILVMQKRVFGQVTTETNKENSKPDGNKGEKSEENELLEKIDKALDKLEKLKTTLVLKEDAANESEVLAMIKKFSQK